MRYSRVVLVILYSCFLAEAIREELNVAEINPQDIKSQAALTSGVHLGDFPLPSYLKVWQILNDWFIPLFIVRAPPWSMASMAGSGGRAWYLLGWLFSEREDSCSSMKWMPCQMNFLVLAFLYFQLKRWPWCNLFKDGIILFFVRKKI